MPTYRVQYQYDGKLNLVKFSADNESDAGQLFKNAYPHITSDMVKDVTEIMDDLKTREDDFLTKLFSGKLGLATTYWVYGVLGGIVWAVCIAALDLDPEGTPIQLTWMLFGIYYFFVYVGIWRAANRYSGNKIWAILAKFVVIIVVLPTLIRLLK
jgi:hypothetical protein